VILPYLPDEFIQEVLSRNDIIDVIGGYIQLTKKGNNFWGICPFHGEKTPSFSVKQEQQFYYCFGCHSGGNVIQFIQKLERLDFIDAVRILAERVHLPMPEQNKSTEEYSKLRTRKETMYNATRDAAKFYHNYLYDEKGKEGLEYLTKRGLSPSIIKRFGLGMSPDGWQGLKDYMNELGYEDELLHEIGMLGKKEERYYDSFRNRVIFPIIDHRSKVVGFGGRVMDNSHPKYINSPETPIYNKRYVLYGSHYLKRLRGISSIILVEGYMDVISLHRAGFEAAVASSGTALTIQQAKLIKRYCDNVYICYDGDSAGQKATWRAIDILHAEGLKVKVISLPDNLDPDDFTAKYGIAGINDQIEHAMTMNDYKISIIQKDYDLANEEDRKDFVIKVCNDVLSSIEAPVERSMYVKRLHLKTGFDEIVINQEIDRAEKLHQKSDIKNIATLKPASTQRDEDSKQKSYRNKDNAADQGLKNAERLLFALAVNHSDCSEIIVNNTKKDDFKEGIHREIGELILNRLNNGKKISIANILGELSEKAASELAIALEMPYDKENRKLIVNDCITRIREIKVKEEIEEINSILKDPKLDKEQRIMYMKRLGQIQNNR
jgi:DNA primase